jgi:hypothetical protein
MASVQLCLFTDTEMTEMLEPLAVIEVLTDPLRDLFILPWLRGTIYRQQRAQLTVRPLRSRSNAFRSLVKWPEFFQSDS